MFKHDVSRKVKDKSPCTDRLLCWWSRLRRTGGNTVRNIQESSNVKPKHHEIENPCWLIIGEVYEGMYRIQNARVHHLCQLIMQRHLCYYQKSNRLNDATPPKWKIMFMRYQSMCLMDASSGEDTSTACEPGEGGKGDYRHSESKLQGLATGRRQGTVASDTLES